MLSLKLYLIYRVITEKKIQNSFIDKLTFVTFICNFLYILTNEVLKKLNILNMISTNYLLLVVFCLIFAFILAERFNREYYLLNHLKEAEKFRIKQQNFFTKLSHEIKNPLTLILNAIERYIRVQGNNYELDIIKFNIEKLNREISNMLDVEKIKKCEFLYNHTEIVEVNSFLKKKIDIFKDTAIKKRILINYKKCSTNLYLKIDTIALDRILNNLLSNACKFSPEKSIIEVKVKAYGNDKIELYVIDNGIGIPANKLDKIFDPFYKAESTENIQGSGVGLYIVKGILNEVNAEIKVDSKINEGTIFRILFNRYDLRPDEVNKSYENLAIYKDVFNTVDDDSDDFIYKDETHDNSKRTLLIVEDDFNILSLLQIEFAKNYNVYSAENGVKALEKLNSMPDTDLIISDIMMPVMNGYEFFTNVQDIDRLKRIPFIFITGKTSLKEKIKSLDAGAIDFISKPFNIGELKAKVKTIIENFRRQKNNNLDEFESKILKFLRTPEFHNTNPIDDDIQRKINSLPERKKEILKFFLKGKLYKEIGYELRLQEGTIRKSMSDIYNIFGVSNQVELIQKIYNFDPDIFQN